MSSIVALRGKLAKLVAMLSSDELGERRSAYLRLIEQLSSVGATFVDLAMLIDPNFGNKKPAEISEGKYSSADVIASYQAGYIDGQNSVQLQQPHQIDWHKIADAIEKHIDELSNRDREFVRNVIPYIRIDNELSPKRAKWLKDIYVKLGRRHGFSI
jgi:hypothetical protein